MNSDLAATLAAQVTNFLNGEDIEAIARVAEEPLRTQIVQILPHIRSRATAKMAADRPTREIVVATLRMQSVLMFAKYGKQWLAQPAKELIESLLLQYGQEFPEEISPPKYEQLAAGYRLLKHPAGPAG